MLDIEKRINVESISLSVLASKLEEILEKVEASFIRIGQELQSINSDASELTQQSVETMSIFGKESGEGLLSKVEMVAKATLDKVRSCHTEASRDLALLDGHIKVVTKQLSETYTLYLSLKNTAKYLKTIGLKMQIECSISTHTEGMFLVVAREIRELSNKFLKIADNIRDDSEAASESQASARHKMRKAFHQLFMLVAEAEQSVQNAVQEIERVMNLSIESLNKIGSGSTKISQHVGRIVMALQFHDNMKQRIEHISNALLDVEKSRSEKTRSSSTDINTPNSDYSTIELQKAQLHDIIIGIKTNHEDIKQAFGDISSEIVNLFQGLSVIKGEFSRFSNEKRVKIQDPFEYLQLSLQYLNQLNDSVFSLIEDIHKTVAQASDSVTRLSSHAKDVRELNFETHLTAINAMIKAMLLGKEGKALGKLVKETATISTQSNTFVAKAKDIQDAVAASAKDMRAQTHSGMLGMEIDDTSLTSMDSLSKDISRQGIQFRKIALDTFKRTDALRDAISETMAGLEFLPALANELKKFHQRLEDECRSMKIQYTCNNKLPQDGIDVICQRYTMNTEREIHEQFTWQGQTSTDSGVNIEEDKVSSDKTFNEASSPVFYNKVKNNVDGQRNNKNEFGDNVDIF